MGPIIILDKSVLQSLSPEEAEVLARYYYLNIVPVLVTEIMGDLKKYGDDSSLAGEAVRRLASKLPMFSMQVNAPRNHILTASLLGEHRKLTWQIPVCNAIPLIDKDGSRGFVVNEHPEQEAIARWQLKKFKDGEHLLAQRWRDMTRSLDIDKYRRELRKSCGTISKAGTLEELKLQVEHLTAIPSNQYRYLLHIVNQVNLSSRVSALIQRRWNAQSSISLEKFAPYAFYCLKVEMTFMLGLVHGLVGTRSTNRVDLEYLYYQPFCHIFSSNDKFQSGLSRLFVSDYQDFVSGTELKADLHTLVERWDGLSEGEKVLWRKEYGEYPPENEGSITYRMWAKHLKPRTPGKADIEMSPEKKSLILERIKMAQQALEKHR